MQPSYDQVHRILRPYLKDIKGRGWQDCFNDKENVFFVNGDNLAFFEKEAEGVYLGHYFFNTFRGKDAKAYAKEVLSKMFEKAEVICGLTPVENRKALLMSRWLGFKDCGEVQTIAGPMTHFILTKQEWRRLNE